MDTAFQRASLALRMHGYDENTEPDEIVRVVLGAMMVPSQEMLVGGERALESGEEFTRIANAARVWSFMMGVGLR